MALNLQEMRAKMESKNASSQFQNKEFGSSDIFKFGDLKAGDEIRIRFVEDADKEYEYEELFEKMFTTELKIDCIFPTGGKLKLEEAFSFNSPVA